MASSIGMARDNQRTPLASLSKTRKPFVDLITGRGRRFSGRDVQKHEKQRVRRGRKQAGKKTGEGGFGWKGGFRKGDGQASTCALVPYYIRTATANKPGAPEVMVKSSSRRAIGQGTTPMVDLRWCRFDERSPQKSTVDLVPSN